MLSLAEPRISVRPARPSDLERTAAIHARCLPGGFFAQLGAGFLARYHATFVAGPLARLLVAEDRGTVVGFLAGTVDNRRHYREVVRGRPWRLAASGLAALAADRHLAVAFLRTRTRRYALAFARQLLPGRLTAGGRAEAGTLGVLTHVAVLDEARGSGAGRALVDAFVVEARTAGARELRLVTATGGGAPAFYRKLGWGSLGTRRAGDGTFVEEFVRRP